MTDFRYLTQESRDGLTLLRINRPDKLNALNADVVEELRRAFTQFKSDDAVRAVIITGTGEKAFIAGADIGMLAELGPVDGRENARTGQAVINLIEGLGKPVVAAINGFALGGGCELALACTFRTASENAKIGLPEVGLGIIPGYGGTQRLPRLIGPGRAAEMILTGGMVDAQEALRIGLVNKVFPLPDLLPKTEEIVRTILSKGPIAVRFALESAQRGMQMPLAEGLQLESTLFGLLCSTKDTKEGLKAFLEKRKPKFEGR